METGDSQDEAAEATIEQRMEVDYAFALVRNLNIIEINVSLEVLVA